ncbi:unnamed protein product [Schistosoma mattheei]|uniref:Protein Wnt n=1 Tax=Schistosoma mattheei TaxID=31246 RepID=A0AA85BBS0_9TREM|nr:unnamed protein product [Schistosoma mattheei]
MDIFCITKCLTSIHTIIMKKCITLLIIYGLITITISPTIITCQKISWGLVHSISQLRELLITDIPDDNLQSNSLLQSSENNNVKQKHDSIDGDSTLVNRLDKNNHNTEVYHRQTNSDLRFVEASKSQSLNYPQTNRNYMNPDLNTDNYNHERLNQTQLKQTIQDMNNNNDNMMTTETFVGPDGKLQMSICDHPNGFLRRQKKLCRQYLHLMESVIRGYFMGLKECEYQFSAHRWNCQGHNLTIRTAPNNRIQKRLRYRESEPKNDLDNSQRKSIRIQTYLDKLLSKGTRESAYVLAVTSAGVSHAVTKACSSGLHDNCGCDRTIYDHPREPNFEWSGCSDNIYFGAEFSRQFLDVRERNRLKRNPKLGLTNLHNNYVGRHMVINKMEVQCKCHGVSGSCEMRTCWRSLPKFRHLGAQLQERFHEAIQVAYMQNRLVSMKALEKLNKESNGNALLLSHPALLSSSVSGASSSSGAAISSRVNRNTLDSLSSSTSLSPSSLPSPTENDLIYISESPTFCHHDPRYGSIGTYGRQCDENSQGLNSCHYLCCGRGFKRQTFVQQERCDCKFQWCCKVVCKTCRKTVVISTCN